VFRAGDSAGVIPKVLVVAAEDLDARCNLGTLAYHGLSKYAIGTDIDVRPELGFRVGKKGAKLNTAGEGALGEREPVKSNAKIVAQYARSESKAGSEGGIKSSPAAEGRQCGCWPHNYQGGYLHGDFE